MAAPTRATTRAQLKSYKARIDRIKDQELRRLIPEDPPG
jgi:hypothetical protein